MCGAGQTYLFALESEGERDRVFDKVKSLSERIDMHAEPGGGLEDRVAEVVMSAYT